jgi:hypothetical protein
MKTLMGIQTINENKSNIVIELTKMGPDGNAYAIVRENHEWYIKRANKSTGLIAEDFKYIGGLMNKKDEAYPSYAKAIKHLNLKFKSLAEAYNFEGEINVFENDNLLSEDVAGFSEMRGNGFTGAGNMEENTPMWESEEEEEVEMSEAEEAVDRMLESEDDSYRGNNLYTKNKFKTDQQFYDFIKNLNDYGVDFENNNDSIKIKNNFKRAYGLYLDALEFTEDDFREHGFSENSDKEFAALAEPKDKITYADKIAGAKKNEMSEELKGNQSKIDANKNGKIEADDLAMLRNMNESRMSIETAIENMDRLIGDLTEGLKKKV